ncbi:Alkaline ceramidase 1 [Tupaia chinensis]|uniref:Alkaline ceramidase n=1 Tax=Tupaia chinensis TaxID=246437 RepID=L8Y138_TUPCH|nr:Alkaline ceramidase 1 [Tupaia chinensis]
MCQPRNLGPRPPHCTAGRPVCKRGAAQQVFPLGLPARALGCPGVWYRLLCRAQPEGGGHCTRMPSIFAYQSSEVDWCESNFQHSELVAEFFNTFSNVFFFILGPLMMFLMHPYAQRRSRYIYCVCVLFVVIGSYSIWMPHCYFPAFVAKSRPQFTCLVVVSAVISTFLSVVRPTLNAYGLYTVSVHIVYMVFQEYHKTSDRELRHFIEVSVVLWVLAVSCWVSDRFLCGFWQEINFFYLHSFWHVFISFTFPYLMVSMALVDARYEMPEQTLKVHYWPRDTWPLGVPYVELQGDRKSC